MSRARNPLIFVILIGLWHGLPTRVVTARPVLSGAEGMAMLRGNVAAVRFDPETTDEPLLLRDGFSLAGVDGKLIGSDSNDVWFFELNEDVNDYRAVAEAGTRLELLASSTLERMIADAKARSMPTYRLWNAEVTKYKGRNFIYPRYFLPLREPEDGKQKKEDGKEDTEAEHQTFDPNASEVAINEPNDVLTIPPEIVERLKARRERPMTTSLRHIMDSNEVPAGESSSDARSYSRGADSVFVDRTAYLVEQDDGGFVFVPDALGRNVQRLSLRLLPCEVLELTERTQSAKLEPLRFKITGILTTYKDEQYLLLQKATQTYSHGNFGR
jgi:hypothetical protein